MALAVADIVLDVVNCPDWPRIRSTIASAATKTQLRGVEDTLDAVVCAYIARYARLAPHAVRVLGNVHDGYILTPVTAQIGQAIDLHQGGLPSPRAQVGLPDPSLPSSNGGMAPDVSASSPWADQVQGLEPVLDIDVCHRPATFATAGEASWKKSVREAVAVAVGQRVPADARYGVRIHFRRPAAATANERWDLDNLIKPTIDALAGVLGRRPGMHRHEQPDDECVDFIQASKQPTRPGEQAGALIQVFQLPPD